MLKMFMGDARRLRAISATLFVVFFVTGKAAAQDHPTYDFGNDTSLTFSLYADIGLEYITSDNPDLDSEFRLSAYAEQKSILQFRKNWSLQSVVKSEELDKRDEDDDDEGYGVFLDQLFLQYSNPVFEIYAGKIKAHFGVATYAGLGKYGSDFNDYEIDEKLGFGGAYHFGNDSYGRHTISASLFTADNTVFSDSLFFKRGRLLRSDGGPSNTSELSSFVVGLDGHHIPLLPANMSYHVAGAHLEAGEGDRDDSNSVVFSLSQNGIALTPDVDAQWITEVAHVTNFEGNNEDITFFTVGGTLYWGRYSFTTTYSPRIVDDGDDDDNDRTDHLVAAALGYEIFPNTELLLAYRFREEDDEKDNTVSMSVGYSY